MTKSLALIYDEFAEVYEAHRGVFDMTEIFDDFLRRFDIAQGALLDLGCGAGEPFAAGFIARGWSAVGVDFSRHMLELAARYVPEMRGLHADVREVQFAAGEFDAVTCIYALFHLPREDHAALFKRIFTWLRPGGRLLFTYATQEYTGEREFSGYKEFMGQQLFYSHKCPEQLRTDLEEAGFSVEGWDYRTIGGETFLWVIAGKPGKAASPDYSAHL